MDSKIGDFVVLLAYALAGISGAVGGCGAAGMHLLRPSNKLTLRLVHLMAYAIIGFIAGIMFAAYGLAFRSDINTLAQVVPGAIMSGFGIALALASTNFSTRWILSRLGIEVELTVRRTYDEERRDQSSQEIDK